MIVRFFIGKTIRETKSILGISTMSFPTTSVNSESPIHPMTLKELEALQEVNCSTPPKLQEEDEDNFTEGVLKSPTFQAWRAEMTPLYTRQYLMTNFLQYAWKTEKTYNGFPYAWTKPVKNPKPDTKDHISMKMLDKDAPDHHYLAVFYLYQIPIYNFHINPVKRIGKTSKVAKTEAPKTKSVVALKKDNEKMRAELEELKQMKAELEAMKQMYPDDADDLYTDAKASLGDDCCEWLEGQETDDDKFRDRWDGLEELPKMRRVMVWAKFVEGEYRKTLKK